MQEINTLAKTLVSLEDEEKIRQVQGKICELVFERLTDLPEQRKKENNELTTIRFHLIPGRRFNLEQFNEQLFLSVSKSETGKWRFRPEAGAEYLTYLKFIIGKRVSEFDNSGFLWETEGQYKGQENQRILSIEELSESGMEIPWEERELFSDTENLFPGKKNYSWNSSVSYLKLKPASREKMQMRFTYDMIVYLRGKLDRSIEKENRWINYRAKNRVQFSEDILQQKRENEWKELEWMESLFLSPLLDFYFQEKTRTCREIYCHSLHEGRILRYDCLNQFLNQYLETKGYKKVSLDSMKKWFGNHNEEYVRILREVFVIKK